MEVSKLKRRLVGTAVGRSIMRGRQLWELWRTLRRHPETGGVASQDACLQILLPRLCEPSAVFVDVGSHIGSVIAAVMDYDPSIRIIAIEADPEKAGYLGERYPSVEVHGVALGESEGEVAFFIDKKRPGYSSLSREGRPDTDVVQVSVKMRRLDDVVSPAAKVDVVKIDVEGAELGVLRGAVDLVARCRPVVVFESGPDESQGYSIGDLFDWFAERRYQVLVPNRVAHDGPSLGRDGFIEAHYYPFRTLDFVAVPAERRREIRDRARRAMGIRATH
jgi:FkbM family methyltransferase